MPQTLGIAHPPWMVDDAEALMAVRDPHSPRLTATPDGDRSRGEVELDEPTDPRDPATLLRPADPGAEPATLRRHLDECVAHAVEAGLCRGTALAAHASVLELCGDDLPRADAQLVATLRRLLGLPPLPRQEN
jgi:hypothetical protein